MARTYSQASLDNLVPHRFPPTIGVKAKVLDWMRQQGKPILAREAAEALGLRYQAVCTAMQRLADAGTIDRYLIPLHPGGRPTGVHGERLIYIYEMPEGA